MVYNENQKITNKISEWASENPVLAYSLLVSPVISICITGIIKDWEVPSTTLILSIIYVCISGCMIELNRVYNVK